MTRAMWCAGVGLAALAGCGSDAAPVLGIEHGTRLRARFWEAEGGARVFRTWHDQGLDAPCEFVMATDGRYRCLPTGAYLNPAAFGDAACTRPVLVVPDCRPAPRYLTGRPIPTPVCADPSGVPILPVGPRRVASSYFLKTEQSTCVAAQALPGQAVHDVGAELSPDEFVAADLHVEGSTHLAPYVLRAEDGAVFAVSTWDTERDGECEASGPDGDLRCTPREIALHYDWIWADAACSVQAAVDLSQIWPCARPTAVASGLDGVAEIGDEVPFAGVHTSSQGPCVPAAPELGVDRFYLEGAPIPTSSLPSVTAVRAGSDRLRAERFTDEAGRALAASTRFYDTVAGSQCYPARSSDGTTRCVANYPSAGAVYADAACTMLLLAGGGGPPPAVTLLTHQGDSACDLAAIDGAYAAAAAFAGATIYFVSTATLPPQCTPLARDPQASYYHAGAPVELPILRER